MTRGTVATIALVAALTLAGCGGQSSEGAGTTARASGESDMRLVDLTSVQQLRAAFNEDRGTPRLILLLSPT